MPLASTVNFLSATVNLISGLVVFFYNPQRVINRIAALIALTLVGWQFSAGLAHCVSDPTLTHIFGYLAYSSDAFMPPTLVLFTLLVRRNEKIKFSYLKLFLLYLPSFVFVALFTSGVMFLGREAHWWGYGGIYTKWFRLYALWFWVMGIAVFWQLFMAYQESKDTCQKTQMMFFLIGITVPYLCGAIFDIGYPAITGHNIFPVAAEATMVTSVFFLLGIVKYQLLDIKIVLNKAFVYTVLSVAITLCYSGLVIFIDRLSIIVFGRVNRWTGACVALVVATMFSPLKKRIQQWADKLFYKDTYDYQSIAEEFSRCVTSELSIKNLLPMIREKIVENLRLKDVSIIVKEKEQILSEGEIDRDLQTAMLSHLETWKEEADVCLLAKGVLVPLVSSGDEVLGVMFCGEKLSGEPFRKQDIKLLSVLGRQAGLAIKNAMLFKELEQKKEELIRMYEDLLKNKKLATLGEISAGIAHELRNPLSIIKGAAQVLKDEEQPQEVHQEMMDFILSEVEGLEATINDFLTFASLPKPEPLTVETNKLVAEIVKTWQLHNDTNGCHIKMCLGKKVRNLFVDPGQIRQVIFNLLNNAKEAIEEKGEEKGEITVTTRNKRGDDKEEICILDTGCGIKEEIKEKIFEPFFTTKVKGTGLGLAIVKQIVKANNGEIYVESEYGKGTSFIIQFPTKES